MRYLLDSHAALWAMENPARLSPQAHQIITGLESVVFFSPASGYELSLKAQLGKMPALPGEFSDISSAQGFVELPITGRHADLAARLPLVNRDPWDRIIAAQSISEGMTLITKDSNIAALGAAVLW